jgi:hypothetical protein
MLITIVRAITTIKLEGEVTFSQGTHREKWKATKRSGGDFWEKLIAINRNIASLKLPCPNLVNSFKTI